MLRWLTELSTTAQLALWVPVVVLFPLWFFPCNPSRGPGPRAASHPRQGRGLGRTARRDRAALAARARPRERRSCL